MKSTRLIRRLTSVFAPLASVIILAGAPALAKDLTIGVSLASDTNPFYVAIRKGIEEEATKQGVKTIFVTANEDIAKQISGVQDLIVRGVDAILVSPIDSFALAGAYKMADAAGIPPVSVVRFVDSPAQRMEVTFDWTEIGANIAQRLAKEIGEEGDIAMITGPSGAKLFSDLATGFKEKIEEYPGINVVFEREGPITREFGLSNAEDALTAFPDIAGIYGGNDEQAMGASQAVNTAGLKGKVAISGLNGVPSALQAVKNGDLLLTYDLNPPAWGAAGLDAAIAFAKGKTPSVDQLGLNATLVDASNIADYVK